MASHTEMGLEKKGLILGTMKKNKIKMRCKQKRCILKNRNRRGVQFNIIILWFVALSNVRVIGVY